MSYQRGSLRTMHRKGGDIWVLRYRVTQPDGSRMEKIERVGLVRDFPKERDARREADRLLVRINDAPADTHIRFEALAKHYLKADFGENALRPKSENTIAVTEHIVRDYLIDRWGIFIADDIKPLDIQLWLKSLHDDKELAWTTIAKMRGIMSRIYKVGMLHDRVAKNPLLHVESRSKTDYRAIVLTPAQTFGILKALTSMLHFTLVLTCAATALRASEILALRWADIEWGEKRIRVSKRRAKGKDGETKTEASNGYVPLHPLLAEHLRAWHAATPNAKDTDFVFPSLKCSGRFPSPLPSSSPTICDRRRKRQASPSRTGSASGFTIFAIHFQTGSSIRRRSSPKPCRASCVTHAFRRRWISTRRKTAQKHRPRKGDSWRPSWLQERCNELCGTVCGTDFSRVSG